MQVFDIQPPRQLSDSMGDEDPSWVNIYKFEQHLDQMVIHKALSTIALCGYIEKPLEVESDLLFRLHGQMDQVIYQGVDNIKYLSRDLLVPRILSVSLISREDAIRQVSADGYVRSYDITQTAIQLLAQDS